MFSLTLFGGVSLIGEDGPLAGPAAQRRRLALLSLLAAAPRDGVSRDKLIARLWPELDAEAGRSRLADSLYALRKAMGLEAILAVGDNLQLNPMLIRSDVAEFRGALARGDRQAAVALYQGPFLDGFFLPHSPEFERWVEAERARYAREFGQALEALAEAQAAADPRGAVESWRRLAAHDPYCSRVALRLMQTLETAGDAAGALQHARVHELLLRETLEIEPDREVTALAERLRSSRVVLPPRAEPIPESPQRAAISRGDPNGTAAELAGQLSTVFQTSPEEAVPPAPAKFRRAWRPRRGLAWAGALLLIVTLTGTPVLLRSTPSLNLERVFVAAFDNQTGDPALDPLGRMAADWVTQGLAQAGVAEVVPTIMPFGIPTDVKSASAQADVGSVAIAHAHRARAGTVVWGSYYRQGDSVLVQAQVTDVRTGRLLGAIPAVGGRADRPLEVVEAMRGNVIAVLAARFDKTVSSLAGVSSQPPSLEAYREYAAGVENFLRSEYLVAVEHFDHAVALDSSFTMAAIWGVFCRLNLGRYAQADSITQRLIPLREQLPPFDRTMLDALRATFLGDLHAQARATRAGAELAPGSFGQYAAAFYALRVNRPGEAVELLAGVDPDRADHRGWIWYWDVLTSAHHLRSEHRQELKAAREARKRYPDRLQAVVWEARALAGLGRIAELEETLLELAQVQPVSGPTPGAALRLIAEELRAHGHRAASERLLERALSMYEQLPAERSAAAEVRFGFAEVLYRIGRYREARERFAALAAENPASVDYLGYLGVIAAREADPHEAERIAAQLASLDRPYLFGRDTFWRARIAALLGQQQEALRLLHAAFAEGRPYSTAWHSEPDFETLHSNPAFRRLLRPPGSRISGDSLRVPRQYW